MPTRFLVFLFIHWPRHLRLVKPPNLIVGQSSLQERSFQKTFKLYTIHGIILARWSAMPTLETSAVTLRLFDKKTLIFNALTHVLSPWIGVLNLTCLIGSEWMRYKAAASCSQWLIGASCAPRFEFNGANSSRPLTEFVHPNQWMYCPYHDTRFLRALGSLSAHWKFRESINRFRFTSGVCN